MNFLVSWLIVNYEISIVIIFKTMSIDSKIQFIQGLEFKWLMWFFIPLGVSLFYIYALPLINLGIVKVYDKFIYNWIKEHEHQKRLKSFNHKRKEEEARHNSITFVERDLELKKKRDENAEKERTVELAKKENVEKEKSIQLIKKENEAKEKELALKEQEDNSNNSEKEEYESKLDELRQRLGEIYDIVHDHTSTDSKTIIDKVGSVVLVSDLEHSKVFKEESKAVVSRINSSISGLSNKLKSFQ